MSKNKKLNLRGITTGAMMAALSIILERIIPLMPASNMMDIRVSLSNIPLILASVLVSPVVGAIAGVVSDIVGCFINGYAPFPLLTLAPLVMGCLPGVILHKKSTYSFFRVFVAVIVSHLIASVIITTIGLSVMRGEPLVIMFIKRLPTCGINFVIDTSLVYLLLKTPLSKKF